MPDERRSARRARLSGVQVTYESATDRQQAAAANLSRDGVFVAITRPLAVGKRVSLEIAAAGEPGPWSALGRVVWVRAQAESDERPAGMAVKFIDIEDAVVAAIDRLIETREHTEPGLGEGDPGAAPAAPAPPLPAREKTMLGVGIRSAPVAPVVVPAPGREATLLGVGRDAATDDREPSLAIDLVAKKPASSPPPTVQPVAEPPTAQAPAPAQASPPAPAPAPAEPPAREPDPFREPEPATAPRRPRPAPAPEPAEPEEEEPAARPRRSGFGWYVLILLLAGGGAAGYVYRARVLPIWKTVSAEIAKRLH